VAVFLLGQKPTTSICSSGATTTKSKPRCASFNRCSHITGPSDLGIMGALLAYQLGVPSPRPGTPIFMNTRAAAAKRLRFLPTNWSAALGESIRKGSFAATARFYQIARVFVRAESRACVSPGEIDRETLRTDGPRRGHNSIRPGQARSIVWSLSLGFVGRLTVEKNVCFWSSWSKLFWHMDLTTSASDCWPRGA